tara:strand:- start:1701 stop:1907 length:207 start_codon:yes stop_codon:yes gene_type:complete
MTQIPWTAVFEKESEAGGSEYFAKEFFGPIEHNKMLSETKRFAAKSEGRVHTVCIIKGSHSGGFYADR